ncbi:hypothetical protein CRG98_020785 [Punica granatum]|uniref:Uncharacterized protein n=1 Tax=Punica granatum TaxID=22663 RepID=A0A2I0JR74_PUNGR|nr:hypothetical protein CRG98_020785 [Punica granatum]
MPSSSLTRSLHGSAVTAVPDGPHSKELDEELLVLKKFIPCTRSFLLLQSHPPKSWPGPPAKGRRSHETGKPKSGHHATFENGDLPNVGWNQGAPRGGCTIRIITGPPRCVESGCLVVYLRVYNVPTITASPVGCRTCQAYKTNDPAPTLASGFPSDGTPTHYL